MFFNIALSYFVSNEFTFVFQMLNSHLPSLNGKTVVIGHSGIIYEVIKVIGRFLSQYQCQPISSHIPKHKREML